MGPTSSQYALTFFVGWCGAVAEAAFDMWRPKAPKSYTKPESIATWIDEHRADAAILPFVGKLSTVYVLDRNGDVVHAGSDPTRFLNFANGVGCFNAMKDFDNEQAPHALFIGFNVKQLFQSVAMELMAEQVSVPFRFWRSTPGLIDINDLLIPGDLRNGFDVGSLIQYLGPNFIPANLSHMVGPGQAYLETAEDRATMALALGKFAQL